jgi:hypothetical protein
MESWKNVAKAAGYDGMDEEKKKKWEKDTKDGIEKALKDKSTYGSQNWNADGTYLHVDAKEKTILIKHCAELEQAGAGTGFKCNKEGVNKFEAKWPC